MRRCSTVCIFLLCIAVAGVGQNGFAQAAPAPKALSPQEQTLTGAEKSFIEAAKKEDTAFLKRTLADDFSYVGSDGHVNDRDEFIDDIDGQDLLAYNMKVITISDSVGVVTYDVVVRVPPSEYEAPPRYQHFSTVWVKAGDAWKMKFHQKSVSHWGDW
jgi:hypothetical protein